jgi:hypothetical protein
LGITAFQKMIKRLFPVFSIFFCFSIAGLSQQSVIVSKSIHWYYEARGLVKGTEATPLINAEEVRLTSKGVPVLYLDYPLAQQSTIEIALKNVQTQETDPTMIAPGIQYSLGAEFSYTVSYSTHNKQPVANIAIIALKATEGYGITALRAVDIEITTLPVALKKTVGSTTFKANSVLAQGTFYKISISNTGLYKLDYNYFKNLGYDMNSINPKNIHIYSKGGGMLPRSNNAAREDDLPENAIYVNGEPDGKFDAQDYVVFYGKAQTVWNLVNGTYVHTSNYYDETTYYFLSVDNTPGVRVTMLTAPSGTPNQTVTSGDEYVVHEINKVNDYQSGAELLGESFNKNTEQNFAFTIPDILTSEPVYFRSSEVAHSVGVTTGFNISNHSTAISSRSCNPIIESFDQAYYSVVNPTSTTFTAASGSFNIRYQFNKNGNTDARGWLDYFELVCRRNLVQGGGQMSFRDKNSVGASNISLFNLSTSTPTMVWDVTDCVHIKSLNTTFSAPVTSFKIATDVLHVFISFKDEAGNYFTPLKTEKVENQNLHASPFADLIIISHPDFLAQANRLADHRRQKDGLRVLVTTPQLIYNEFSSGAQDITAIREFVRMLYNKATTAADEPKYLLLFGDASYHYKEAKVFVEADNRYYDNTNFVPTFESDNYYDTDSYASDDYYGLLDDNEGLWLPNSFEAMDIGIGRLPVDNATEAEMIVDKILRYESPEALGDWRNALMFVADDQEYNSHLHESQQVSNLVSSDHTEYNVNKIYLDAYKQVSLGSGYAFPDATDAVNRGIQRGSLVVNYTGHGSSTQLAHEGLLTTGRDIVNWKNKNHLPVFVTATCSFTEFDHITKVSAGEEVIMNENGGGIALLTTTRVAYSNVNLDLNTNFNNDNAFEKTLEGGARLGDIMKLTKNTNGRNNSPSAKHFILLGDPSMRLAVPKYNVITTKVNNNPVTADNDTMRALQKVSIEGFVADMSNDTVNGFNGEVSVTVYDKPGTYSTLANDADSYKETFTMQKNFVFKGIAAVTNGTFKIAFVIPKDISYNYGLGKISYYASDKTNNVDGSGSYMKVVIGGSDNSAVVDSKGPEIKLFINDTTFMNGGTTHENPLLIAHLFDENGINTSGVSIGHEMTASLDFDNSNPSVLNDFYEGTLNDFQRGKVSYPYYNLALGTHIITVKVWDIYNNSGTASISFIVVDKNELKIDRLMNYPNPFNPGYGPTTFSFEHNRAGEPLEVTLEVYSVTGEKIRTLILPKSNGSTRFDELEWNGNNELGAPLPAGTYIFKAFVKDKDNHTASQSSRLVIVR